MNDDTIVLITFFLFLGFYPFLTPYAKHKEEDERPILGDIAFAIFGISLLILIVNAPIIIIMGLIEIYKTSIYWLGVIMIAAYCSFWYWADVIKKGNV